MPRVTSWKTLDAHGLPVGGSRSVLGIRVAPAASVTMPTGKPWALGNTGIDCGLQRGDHAAAGRNEPRMKKAMAPSIYISYRRVDSGYAVGRISQCLADSFGREAELEALDRAWGEGRVRQAFQPDNSAAPASLPDGRVRIFDRAAEMGLIEALRRTAFPGRRTKRTNCGTSRLRWRACPRGSGNGCCSGWPSCGSFTFTSTRLGRAIPAPPRLRFALRGTRGRSTRVRCCLTPFRATVPSSTATFRGSFPLGAGEPPV